MWMIFFQDYEQHFEEQKHTCCPRLMIFLGLIAQSETSGSGRSLVGDVAHAALSRRPSWQLFPPHVPPLWSCRSQQTLPLTTVLTIGFRDANPEQKLSVVVRVWSSSPRPTHQTPRPPDLTWFSRPPSPPLQARSIGSRMPSRVPGKPNLLSEGCLARLQSEQMESNALEGFLLRPQSIFMNYFHSKVPPLL